MPRDAVAPGSAALAVPRDAVGTKRPQDEWERVRRQRIALEQQQQTKRARHGRNGEAGEAVEAAVVENDVVDDNDEEGEERANLVALQTQERSTDPFACCCRPLKLKKLGQSYILHERRVVERGRVRDELVLVGPHWFGVLVTLAIVVGCTALFLRQQCARLPWHYTLITLAFCFVTLRYLYGVACKDPGIVRRAAAAKKDTRRKRDAEDHTTIVVDDDDGDQEEEEGGETVGARVRGGGGGGARRLAPDAPAVVPPPSYFARFSPRARFCDVCEVAQDAYTEHCDDCGVCIEDYDHHCPWMGKCIGKKNMHAFKMFNVSWVCYVIFVLFVSIQNVDWGDAAVQRLHRLSTGQWVPLGTTEKPH